MEIECRYKESKWLASIELLNASDEGQSYEVHIKGRGSAFHGIIGRFSQGIYLCVPGRGLGSGLAPVNDILWNEERLSRCVSIIDAITLSRAISLLESL
jgi:hypothetical protein